MSLQSIHLACLCHSNDVKNYGYTAILDPLLKDLEVLEQQGLYVQKLRTSVRGTVLHVSTENLRVHLLAGLQESFNVDKFCWFSLVTQEHTNIPEMERVFPFWTDETHKYDLMELNTHQFDSLNGVKKKCVFNRLSHFHTVQGFSPDFSVFIDDAISATHALRRQIVSEMKVRRPEHFTERHVKC